MRWYPHFIYYSGFSRETVLVTNTIFAHIQLAHVVVGDEKSDICRANQEAGNDVRAPVSILSSNLPSKSTG